MRARSAIAQHPNWELALDQVLAETDEIHANGSVSLAVLFASAEFSDDLDSITARARAATGAQTLIGCTGQGIIGPERETEGAPAISLLLLSAPGAQILPARVTQQDLQDLRDSRAAFAPIDVPADELNGLLVFADPFTIDPEGLVQALDGAYPTRPIAGGLASGAFVARKTWLFLNNAVYDSGAVVVGIGGSLGIHPVVSQGATPIGEPWTITHADGHVIATIGQRPAYEVLAETFNALPLTLRERAQRNLLVGLAIDEYKDAFCRGDFLIRNLVGVDQKSGAIGVGAHPHIGQTIQFQLRDADAADEDLRLVLGDTRDRLRGAAPVAGILCSCNGRGVGLFGAPNHDARAIADAFGPLPVAGFFCNGEIGPIGQKPFLHGYTASLALFVECAEGRGR